MADFRINIVTNASSAVGGAKETADALKKVGDAGKEASKGIGDETGKATSKTAEFKKVIAELTREFPLLGQVARLAVNPITAAAALAASAFQFLHSKIKGFEEELADTEWERYGKKAGLAAAEVRAVASAAKDAEAATARLVDVFKARQSAEERLANARKQLELAQAQGERDPVKRAQRLLEIENRYAQQELAREERSRQFMLQRQEERAQNLRAEAARQGRAEQSAIAMSRKTGTPEEAQAELEAFQKRLEKTRAARIKREEDMQSIYNSPKWASYAIPFYSYVQGVRGYQAGLEVDSLRAQESGLELDVADRQQKLKLAQSIARRAEAAGANKTEALQSAQGIEAMLPTQRTVAEIEGAAARGAAGLESQARAQTAANEAGRNVQAANERLAQVIEGQKSITWQMVQELEGLKAWQSQIESRLANARSR